MADTDSAARDENVRPGCDGLECRPVAATGLSCNLPLMTGPETWWSGRMEIAESIVRAEDPAGVDSEWRSAHFLMHCNQEINSLPFRR